jgi:hypothetical protein
MAARLRQAGVPARVEIVPGEGHGWKGDKLHDSLKEMRAFFDDTLRK